MIADNLATLRHASLGSDACEYGIRFKRCVKNPS
jgi:hypothetical protein